MTIDALLRRTTARLEPALGAREARATVELVLEQLKGWDAVQRLMHGDEEAGDWLAAKVEAAAARVLEGEPVQYVLGCARWRGMELEVNPSVLIPRPETAQLVDLVADDMAGRKDLRVLDLGTGSGAIAIALARELPFARVTAIDVSPEALATARRNAAALKARADFVEADMTQLQPDPARQWDVIVSNPPYVLDSEKPAIDIRVKGHEPSTALFVPDSDPLRYYRPVTRYAAETLAPGGGLYYEINPLTADLLLADVRRWFPDARPVRDVHGVYRFLAARR